jgi:hypothetical protein
MAIDLRSAATPWSRTGTSARQPGNPSRLARAGHAVAPNRDPLKWVGSSSRGSPSFAAAFTGRRSAGTRRGTAAVELAVCLPILVLVIMGSLECCGMIFLNQSLHIAAYEGARVGIRSDADNADVTARANEILDVRDVQSATIVINPPDVRAIVSGQTVTITVTAPCDENSIFTPWFFQGRTLAGETTMIKE